MNYRTSIDARPPVDPVMAQNAMAGMQAPASVPGVQADVYAGTGQRNALNYGRTVSQANAQYVTDTRRMQAEMALRGLQQLVQQRQYQNDAVNATLTQRNRQQGMLNSLLSGLYG
jgi:hypothetical protein